MNDKTTEEIVGKIVRDGMDMGSSLIAKHALRQCRILQGQLIVLMRLLESQLTEEDKENGGPSGACGP